MATLIDSSLWIDLTRARSPRTLKTFVAAQILAPDAVLAEPVVFEVLRYASDDETSQLQQQFQTLPMLSTPADLWHRAAELGRNCRKRGINAGAMDLLIASVALFHRAELMTFDGDFQRIADVCDLRLILLQRPSL